MHKMIKRASDASSKLTKCAPEAHAKRDALPRLTHGGLVDRLSDQKNVHEREHNSTKTDEMIKRAPDASSNLTKYAPEAKVKRDALSRVTHGSHLDRLSDQKNVHERKHNSTKTHKMIKRASDASSNLTK